MVGTSLVEMQKLGSRFLFFLGILFQSLPANQKHTRWKEVFWLTHLQAGCKVGTPFLWSWNCNTTNVVTTLNHDFKEAAYLWHTVVGICQHPPMLFVHTDSLEWGAWETTLLSFPWHMKLSLDWLSWCGIQIEIFRASELASVLVFYACNFT